MIARAFIAKRLRFLADRIDHAGAPKCMSYAFTFELHRGMVVREGTRQGCPLWYYGDADYERAHDEAEHPAPRVDWERLAPRAKRTGGAGLRNPRSGAPGQVPPHQQPVSAAARNRSAGRSAPGRYPRRPPLPAQVPSSRDCGTGGTQRQERAHPSIA